MTVAKLRIPARRLLFSLAALTVVEVAVNAATLQLDVFSVTTPVCTGTVTASPVATLNGNGCSITASEGPWSTSVTASGTFGSGAVVGTASLNTLADIMGGTGSGYVDIIYTDSIKISSNVYEGSILEANAGSLSFSEDVAPWISQQPINMTLTQSTGFIPIDFGEGVPVSEYADLDFSLNETGLNADISETVTFDIRDANMNPVAGAYAAAAVPEPAPFLLCGTALMAISIVRRFAAGCDSASSGD